MGLKQINKMLWINILLKTECCTAAANPHTYCRVVEEKNHNRYQLLTKHGMLKNWNSTRELLGVQEHCRVDIDGTIPAVEAASTARVSLHTVTRRESYNMQVGISCNCKGSCTGRCDANRPCTMLSTLYITIQMMMSAEICLSWIFCLIRTETVVGPDNM